MVIKQQQILLPHYQTPGWSDAWNDLLAGCARHMQIKALPCCCNISSSHYIYMLQSICKGLNVAASLVVLYHTEPFINFFCHLSLLYAIYLLWWALSRWESCLLIEKKLHLEWFCNKTAETHCSRRTKPKKDTVWCNFWLFVQQTLRILTATCEIPLQLLYFNMAVSRVSISLLNYPYNLTCQGGTGARQKCYLLKVCAHTCYEKLKSSMFNKTITPFRPTRWHRLNPQQTVFLETFIPIRSFWIKKNYATTGNIAPSSKIIISKCNNNHNHT